MSGCSTFNLIADRYVEGGYSSPAAQLLSDQCSNLFSGIILTADWGSAFCSQNSQFLPIFGAIGHAFRQAKVVIGITSLLPLIVKGVECIVPTKSSVPKDAGNKPVDNRSFMEQTADAVQNFLATCPSFASDLCGILVGLDSVGYIHLGSSLAGFQLIGSASLSIASAIHLCKELQRDDLAQTEKWILIAKDVSCIALGIIGCTLAFQASTPLLAVALTISTLWLGLDIFHYLSTKHEQQPAIQTSLDNSSMILA